MKALRYDPKSKTFGLDHIPVPRVLKEDDLLIEVKFSGLCGTDLHIAKGSFPLYKDQPLTLGHEFAGIVSDSGRRARNKFPKGLKVGVDPNQGCYECDFCSVGKTHLCQDGGFRKGLGFFRDGGLAEFVLVPMKHAIPLPQSVALEQAALCEPLSCLVHSWNKLQRYGPIRSGDQILILGAGIIGLLFASMFHHFGLRNVIMCDTSPGRRNLAADLGLGYKVMSPEELEAFLPQSSLGIELHGPDVLVDCTGSPLALEKAFASLKRGAMACVFGCAPAGQFSRISSEEVVQKELILFGVLANPLTFSTAIQLADSMGPEKLDYTKLGIKTFKLEEHDEALRQLEAGSISKAMFAM